MAKDTPSMAKNKIKRSLVAIYDPHPSKTDENQLWEYFESSCAYCGIFIERKSRTGHLDHLIPTSEGGSNDIHNHALSCARCNGDEKREQNWVGFLRSKALDEVEFSRRKTKIDNWLEKSRRKNSDIEFEKQAEEIISKAIAEYECSVTAMRKLRDKIT
ncbi:MAG: HNH endonuclease [Gammaproteobacteria bacterium]|uniref:HNH endonuclease n=1 Tax=Methylotuvimicrobium sp. TaxID=2822413 RepID=UPI001D8F5954|nr:HNH endonuclease [Gammaproteobacteria bacterium]